MTPSSIGVAESRLTWKTSFCARAKRPGSTWLAAKFCDSPPFNWAKRICLVADDLVYHVEKPKRTRRIRVWLEVEA
jgi:hypothetical protein